MNNTNNIFDVSTYFFQKIADVEADETDDSEEL